jgi:hypothetical protein
MKKQKPIIAVLIVLTLWGCKNNPFPEVKELTEFKKTVFLPGLETPFDFKQNAIYAASFLMAWDEIKNEVRDPIREFDCEELARMDSSDSYKNVMSENEYESSIQIKRYDSSAEGEDFFIHAYAYFRKSLPFMYPLKRDEKPLQFLLHQVSSFGFSGDNSGVSILYYKNDDDFAIGILPKDQEHEIILMKSSFNGDLILKNEIHRLEELVSEFKQGRDDKNRWKYNFNDDDRVSIPIIEFNIETNYPEIEGCEFFTDNRNFFMLTASQRTAFVLNEKGAEIESEGGFAMAEFFEELPKPKMMIFDKPYLILLKKRESRYPYFAMFVANSEILKREYPVPKQVVYSETFFEMLGMLGEYISRFNWITGEPYEDLVESFSSDELDLADYFENLIITYEQETGDEFGVIKTISPAGVIHFESEILSQIINAQYIIDSSKIASLNSELLLRADTNKKINYIKGCYLRFGTKNRIQMVNAGEKINTIGLVLKELGCTRIKIYQPKNLVIPMDNVLTFEPSDILKNVIKGIPDKSEPDHFNLEEYKLILEIN